MRRRKRRRQLGARRRADPDFMTDPVNPVPSSPKAMDDQKLLVMVSNFAAAKDIEGLRNLIEQVTSQDPDQGEILIQSIKLKHPEAYRLLRKEDGRGYDSFTDQIVDKQFLGRKAKQKARRGLGRYTNRRAYDEYDARPDELDVEELEGDLDTEIYVDEDELDIPIALGDDFVVEFDEKEIEPRNIHDEEVAEGEEDEAVDVRKLKKSSRLSKRRQRRQAEEPENDMVEYDDLDLGDLDLDGLELEGLEDLDLDDEDLDGLSDEEALEDGDECAEGEELKCVPVDDGAEEEKEEEEEEEKEEDEDDEEKEEEAEEDDDATEASTKSIGNGYMVERLFTEHDLADLKDAQFELVPFHKDTEDPRYAVFADGYPVASIHLVDQNLQGKWADMFYKPSYVARIKEGLRSFGVAETFKQVKARYYAVAAYEGDVAQAVEAKVRSNFEGERRETLANLHDSFMNVVALVCEGSIKNHWGENPLKGELQKMFAKVGADEQASVDLIEAAWREAAAPYFEFVVNKADELMGTHPEVLAHHAAEIAAMEYKHPGYAGTSIIEDAPAQPPVVAQRRGFANVPIATGAATVSGFNEQQAQAVPVTAQPKNAPQDRNFWRKKIGLGGRFANATAANYSSFKRKIGE